MPSHCTVTFLEEEKEGTTFNYCPVYGANMGKCWDKYWKNHYYFSLKAIFPFLFLWRKSRHGDYLLKKHSNQSLITWSARARDWVLLLLWPAVPEHAQVFAPQHGGKDIQGCLEDTASWDIGSTGHAACWDLSLPRQSCPLELSEHSAFFLQNPSSQHLSRLWGIFCKLCVH